MVHYQDLVLTNRTNTSYVFTVYLPDSYKSDTYLADIRDNKLPNFADKHASYANTTMTVGEITLKSYYVGPDSSHGNGCKITITSTKAYNIRKSGSSTIVKTLSPSVETDLATFNGNKTTNGCWTLS